MLTLTLPKISLGEPRPDARDRRSLLSDAGFDEPLMYTPLDDGRVYAFTDSVCTIVIEYYALDNVNPKAIQLQDRFHWFDDAS